MKLNDLVLRYLKPVDRTQRFGGNSRPAGDLSLSPPSSCDFNLAAKDWPPGWHDLFDERAAIMEHDGNMESTDAELLALEDVTKRFH
jgi:hypothetical protein